MTEDSSDTGRASALAEVEHDYPYWRAWTGVLGGIFYARRPRSSPPMVVRATTVEDLRQAIEDAETARGLR